MKELLPEMWELTRKKSRTSDKNAEAETFEKEHKKRNAEFFAPLQKYDPNGELFCIATFSYDDSDEIILCLLSKSASDKLASHHYDHVAAFE